jgi:adenylate cyclase
MTQAVRANQAGDKSFADRVADIMGSLCKWAFVNKIITNNTCLIAFKTALYIRIHPLEELICLMKCRLDELAHV